MGHHKLKIVQRYFPQHHPWSRIIFEKSQFLPLLDLVDPFGHPPVSV